MTSFPDHKVLPPLPAVHKFKKKSLQKQIHQTSYKERRKEEEKGKKKFWATYPSH
jgi:hypothetical protein